LGRNILSVSKNKVTSSLLKSEKKSLKRFLALYVALVLILISVLAFYYYQSQEKLMLAEQRATLDKYAYIQTKRLKVLHHFFDERREYPRDSRFMSAIYDLEYMQIFSLLEEEEVHFDEGIYLINDHIHFVTTLADFYLGTKYLVIEIRDDGLWRQEIWRNIIGYGLVIFIIFLLLGLFLAKLFLKPMRDSIVLLDRFIKDTTHELNTPLSTILANIEMMDKNVMVDKNIKKLNRINIAAKTVSILYKDLTYLTLEQEQKNQDETIALKALIQDRAEYFSTLAQSKQLECILELEESTLYADKRKITRVIDNLISNAVKYNRRNGTVGIRLRQGELTIWDTGIGIKDKNLPFMFDRYLRFNESEGGFGIGLSIVKSILDEYNIEIEVNSEEDKGTKVVLKW
jgi:two-component system OmpR family sensor kinase